MSRHGRNFDQFEYDHDGFTVVYIDGSCQNNGRPYAKAGFGVYFGSENSLNRYGPVSGRATNNAGEIQAAILAIQLAGERRIKHLCIKSDSQFLLNAVTRWMRTWKRNGWNKSDGYPVENLNDFQNLDRTIYDYNIQLKWEYVPAHSGNFGNECADRLAKRGAERYRT